jgi:succinate dehydrogenase/fumarate reductase cytochrome b subunit
MFIINQAIFLHSFNGILILITVFSHVYSKLPTRKKPDCFYQSP